MDSLTTLKIGLGAVMANRLRSALTILGVTIGIAAVIGVVAIGEGAQNEVTGEIESLGTYLITVSIRGRGPDRVLTQSELDDIVQDIPGIAAVSPVVTASGTAKHGTDRFECSIVGVNNQYSTVRDMQVESGRFISAIDVNARQKAAILGQNVALELFGLSNPVGETIKLNGQTFSVIGVMESRGGSITGSEDDQVIIPATTAERLLGRRGFTAFYIKGQDKDSVDVIASSLENRLNRRFRDEDAYRIFNQTQVLEIVQSVSRTLTLMLGGIAFISLLVGGIGIMNIMLVSVVERTREIGLRKAVGATNRDILSQFLLESVVLSLIGAVLGIGVGTLLARSIAIFIGISPVFPWKGAAIAIALATAVGVSFGSLPAKRAANLEPIQALRTE
ncbi:MAG TPA: FtsX-like permease family protein [Firmicutes bacterium]|jgi:putative ABC transport system permease protein|nr:FtsX-like permease family protein [Bacillota bacterium]